MKPTLEQIKTDESVWPEGATHYIEKEFTQWIDGNECYWVAVAGGWSVSPTNWSIEDYKQKGCEVIPRPTKAFVPEVGVECEYWLKRDADAVFKCEPKYVSEKMVVAVCFIHGQIIEQAMHYTEAEFHPIKSDREKFIELVGSKQLLDDMSVNDLAGALYDAGCRFMEPTK